MRDKLFQGCDDPFHRAKALCQKPATHIPTMMNLVTVISLLKKVQNVYESRDTPPEFC